MIENHMKTCDSCSEYLQSIKDDIKIEIEEDETNRDEDKIIKKISKYQNNLKYSLIVILMILAICNIYFDTGIIKTIPLIIIVPLILNIFFDEEKLILIIAIVINTLLAITYDSQWMFVLITILLIVGSILVAITMSKSIKNKVKNIKLISSILLVGISIMMYSSCFGNPISYITAQNNINKYIEEEYKYNVKLQIDKISYNSKQNGYMAQVSHESDNISSYMIYHNTGYLSDGYKFEVRQKISDQVNNIIKTIISQNTKLTKEEIDVQSHIEIPDNKYSLIDDYSGEEKIKLEICVSDYSLKELKYYQNEEAFIKDIKSILNEIYKIDFPYESIYMYSYREDGNSAYSIKLDEKQITDKQIISIDDIYIEEFKK